MKKTEKIILKKLETLSKFDLRKYLNLEKTSNITDEDILTCGYRILFEFEYDDLFYEIENRLNTNLVKLQIQEEDDGVYKLTKYGMELFNRIGIEAKERIIDKKIKIKEITDLSTLKIKTIIVFEYESEKELIITLTQKNIKQAKFNYWEITKQPIYIRGVIDELGLISTIFHFQFIPQPQLPHINFKILAISGKNINTYDYLIQDQIENSYYALQASLIEPHINLTPDTWNYSDGQFESIRGGVEIRLYKPTYNTERILGFEGIEIISTPLTYLDQTIVNLVEILLNTKEKDSFSVSFYGNRSLTINWSDLESQLDLTRREILKKKNTIKKAGEVGMLIRVEGDIRKEEIILDQGNHKTFYYLEEPIIEPENF
jgi:hypothetical protein